MSGTVSVTSAPPLSAFQTAMTSAVQYFEDSFINPVTVNFQIGFGQNPARGGRPLPPSALAVSFPTFDSSGNAFSFGPVISYATLVSALSSGNAAGAGTLPASAPNGLTLVVQPAEEIALGLLSNGGAIIDGDLGFTAKPGKFSYSGVPGTNSYAIVGTAEHEISELMGRRTDLDVQPFNTSYDPLDLFRFVASGFHVYNTATAPFNSAYFSINGGQTSLGRFNITPGADFNDWDNGNGPTLVDPYNAYGTKGVPMPPSPADITVMSAIGWKTSGVAAAVSSGAVVSSANVSSGNILNVLIGGIVSAVNLYNSAVEIFSGLDIGAGVSDGAGQYIAAGGSAIGALLLDPGIQVVSSGGGAGGAILSGGEQDVYGTASGTDIGSGGLEIVYSGGATTSTTVSSGGTLELFGGATATSTTIVSGGILEIAAGNTLSNYVVSSGITL